MSGQNNQGSGFSWGWLIGTGVAALAGAAVATVAMMNEQPTRMEYSPVPRRRAPLPVPQPQPPLSLPQPTPQASQRNSEDASSITSLDDASSTTSSLGEELEGQPQKLCSICLRHLQPKPLRNLACGHVFHSDCIEMWLEINRECAMCRTPVPPNSDS